MTAIRTNLSATTVRRGLYGMFAGGLLAFGSAAIIGPVANAQPVSPTQNHTCSASAIASTSSTVSAATSTYLADNVEVDGALTAITEQSPQQVTQAYRLYFAQNPQVESELQQINRPAVEIASQCGIELSPTPFSEALTDL